MRRFSIAAGVLLALGATTLASVPTAGAQAAPGLGAAAEALEVLRVTDRPLAPSFSPDQPDYTVRCEEGANELPIEIKAAPAATLTVNGIVTGPDTFLTARAFPDDLIHVEVRHPDAGSADYWIRCLPPDFPRLDVRGDGGPDGWYLTSSGLRSASSGPFAMILDEAGAPVWYRRTDRFAIDFKRLATGELAWGPFGGAFNQDPDADYLLYSLGGALTGTVAAVGVPTDHHELVLLPNGNYLLIAYVRREGPVDFSGLDPAIERPEEVFDGYVQEVTQDGELVWEWRTQDHVPFSEVVRNGRDPHHLNSVEATPDGDIIISARHLDAIYRIDRPSGEIEWKLGGKPPADPSVLHLDIVGDPLGGPVAQHDARLIAENRLTLYDNHSAGNGVARAVEYELDLDAGTATLVWEYRQPDGLASWCCGSTRRQPEGTTVIGWGGMGAAQLPNGRQPWFTEVDAEGNVLFEVIGPGLTYRVIKEPESSFDRDQLRRLASSQVAPTPDVLGS